jgi:hypothetical protein
MRVTVVGFVAGALLVSGGAAALAVDTDDDLDEFRAERLEAIGDRMARIEDKLAGIDGLDGVWIDQVAGYGDDALGILGRLGDDVAAAATVEEIEDLTEEAVDQARGQWRVRAWYAHTTRDLERFGDSADRLAGRIDEFAAVGVDTEEAQAEHDAAVAELVSARELLDVIEPETATLDEVREAHRTAHEGNRHLRASREALWEAFWEWFATL